MTSEPRFHQSPLGDWISLVVERLAASLDFVQVGMEGPPTILYKSGGRIQRDGETESWGKKRWGQGVTEGAVAARSGAGLAGALKGR
jgi:hypothetical protein